MNNPDPRRGTHSLAGEGVGVGPNSDEGTETQVLYVMYMYYNPFTSEVNTISRGSTYAVLQIVLYLGGAYPVLIICTMPAPTIFR